MTTEAILTPAQNTVLHLLGQQEDLRGTFVLSGGTALAAFHLRHRHSDDLDFFSLQSVDDLRVRRFVEESLHALGGKTFESNHLYDRHLFIIPLPDRTLLKLEFTQYPYPALEEPSVSDNVRIESMRDVAADKLAALLDRYEPKDYYDIYFLLHGKHATLRRMRADVERKFSIRADPIVLGSALMRAKSLPVLPHLLLPVDPSEVTAFFVAQAEALKTDILAHE